MELEYSILDSTKHSRPSDAHARNDVSIIKKSVIAKISYVANKSEFPRESLATDDVGNKLASEFFKKSSSQMENIPWKENNSL